MNGKLRFLHFHRCLERLRITLFGGTVELDAKKRYLSKTALPLTFTNFTLLEKHKFRYVYIQFFNSHRLFIKKLYFFCQSY